MILNPPNIMHRLSCQSLECRHDPPPADIEETKAIANLPTSSQVKHVHGEIVGNPDRRL
jgi:hypothetical protein